MDRHRNELLKVCRVGGRRFSSFSRSTQYPAKDFVKELSLCFGISVEEDVEGVHPTSICTICRRVVGRYQEQQSTAASSSYSFCGVGCGEPKEWTPQRSGLPTLVQAVISAVNWSSCATVAGRKKRKLFTSGKKSVYLPENEKELS